jgi:hypothetical protein
MLDVIAAWELDAALEDPQRTLMRTAAIARIATGEASVVVGARGAGKTAASRVIVAESSRARPVARIGLKDAFLVALRSLAASDERARASASARYLMLLAALDAMLAEKLLRGSHIRELARCFAVVLEPRLEEALPLAFSKALLHEVFGDRAAPAAKGDLGARIATLELAMAKVLGSARALVLFDETADRSVVAGALDPLRVDALKVLLTGVGDLAKGPAHARVAPVVFTRPGLYARLPDQERAIWDRRRFDLGWTSRELKAAMGHRLARAVDDESPAKAAVPAIQAFLFDTAWSEVWALTRARARDAVFLLRAAARNARHRECDDADPEALRWGRKTYANYLRQDMADEIRDAAPDVEEVLAGLARHGKARMSAQELVEVIERALVEADSPEAVAASRGAMDRFFEASAIGNVVGVGRNERTRFIHDDPDSTLDYTAPVVIHPGLASALDLDMEVAA